MTAEAREHRLRDLGERAEAALATGDAWAANELLRQRRLVEDGGRDADDLLAEGMALIRMTTELASPDAR